jgi:GNAT superfamily N-acetyltransferase
VKDLARRVVLSGTQTALSEEPEGLRTMTISCALACGIPAPAVTIRPADRADYPAMRRVVLAAYQQYTDDIPPDLLSTYLADLVDFERHAQHGQLLVAEIGGRISASAAFYRDAAEQQLGWPTGWSSGRGLAVLPEARGSGVATAMLAEVERLSQEAGARVFAFHTASFMSKAIQLYERLGYQRAPQFDIDLAAHYRKSLAVARQLGRDQRDQRPWTAIAFLRDLTRAAA